MKREEWNLSFLFLAELIFFHKGLILRGIKTSIYLHVEMKKVIVLGNFY